MDNNQKWSHVLDYFSTIDRGDNIIRADIYTNSFIRYTKNGEIEYFRQAVGSPPLPDIIPPRKYSDLQTVFFNEVDPESAHQRTFDIQVIENQIHLLIDYMSGNERVRDFSDVYDVNTGDYLYSYRLPTGLINFAITDKYLAGLPQDTVGIAIWEVKTEW